MDTLQTVLILLLFVFVGAGFLFLIRREQPSVVLPPSQDRYSCVTYAGGNSGCVQDDKGPYFSPQECALACPGPDVKTETVITTVPYYYYGLPDYGWGGGYGYGAYPYYYKPRPPRPGPGPGPKPPGPRPPPPRPSPGGGGRPAGGGGRR